VIIHLRFYPTCFRPDIGGNYQAALSMTLLGTQCTFQSVSSIQITCGATGPVLTAVPSVMTVSVDREVPTRVYLNASGVTAPSTPPNGLAYSWQLLYPTAFSTNPVDGLPLPVPTIVSSQSIVASFWVPQSGVDYVVQLSVSDHCYTSVMNITIHTPCNLVIPLDNKTLAAYYDGSVPVTLLSFAYDHTLEIANYLSSPKCQSYNWMLVDYSSAYSNALLVSTGTQAFPGTPGFAALISVVVVVAVVVPIILFLYCTKKACFKSTDRV